jgi:hypothetical protein
VGGGGAASLVEGLNRSVKSAKGFENAGVADKPAKRRKADPQQRQWWDMETLFVAPPQDF